MSNSQTNLICLRIENYHPNMFGVASTNMRFSRHKRNPPIASDSKPLLFCYQKLTDEILEKLILRTLKKDF